MTIDDLVFTSDNRGISRSNVSDLYHRIEKQGFQPAIGTIDYVQGSALRNSKLYRCRIVRKDESKEWSLSNWELEKEKVTYNDDLKAINDGQHKFIACALLAQITGRDVLTEECFKKNEIPEGFTLPQFIEAKNAGRNWTRKDCDLQELPTGNVNLDKAIHIANEKGLDSQVVIDFCTIGNNRITGAMLRSFRAGTKECKVKITEHDIADAVKIIEAFERNEATSRQVYNSTRLSKGLKDFAKDKTIDSVVSAIEMLSKSRLEALFITPKGVSAESTFYTEAFNKLLELTENKEK